MKPSTSITALVGTLALGALFPMPLSAALIRHWALDETELTTNIAGAWGEVADTTGNSSGGRFFGYGVTEPIPAGVIGVPGPAGYGTSYNFTEATGISGVLTNSPNAIPTVGDFSLFLQVSTTDQQAAAGHLFSNVNGQINRGALYLSAGTISVFLNGGAFDTNNDGFSNGDSFSFLANDTGTGGINVFDGQFHEIGLARQGTRFDLLVDGAVVYSATTTSTGKFDNTTPWMIGRQRSFGGDLDATVADVKIFDTYMVPEPSTALLLGLGGLLLARRRR